MQDTTWSLVDSASPAWRIWGDEFVVHHRSANDTHLLGRAAGLTLLGLVDGTARHVGDLAQAAGVTESETEAILDALRQLGFVTPCRPSGN